MLERLQITIPLKKYRYCRWLTVKELKVNQELERPNGKRSEAFISDSSWAKHAYFYGNNKFACD